MLQTFPHPERIIDNTSVLHTFGMVIDIPSAGNRKTVGKKVDETDQTVKETTPVFKYRFRKADDLLI